MFDTETGRVRHEISSPYVIYTAFSSASDHLIIINLHGTPAVDVVDIRRGASIARLDEPANPALDPTPSAYLATPDLRTILAVRMASDDKGTKAGEKATLRLWDPTTDQFRDLDHGGKYRWGYHAGFTLDGKSLAMWNETGVHFWDVASRKEVLHSPFRLPEDTWGWAFSPDAKAVAVGSDRGKISLWNVADGKEQRELAPQGRVGQGGIHTLSFTADGQTLTSGDNLGLTQIWNVARGERLNPTQGHQSPAEDVVVSPDGKWIASRDVGGIVCLWETIGARMHQRLVSKHPITTIAFPDAHHLLTGDQGGTITLWDVATGQATRSVQEQGQSVASLTASPDGAFIAAIDGPEVHLWDTRTWKSASTWRVSGDALTSVAFSSDGRYLAAGDIKGIVKVWEVSTAKELFSARAYVGPVQSLAFSPVGQEIAVSQGRLRPVHGGEGVKGQVTVWDLATRKQKTTYTMPTEGRGHEEASLAFAPDGQSIFSVGKHHLKTVIQRFGPNRSRKWQFPWPVNALALTPDGRHLVTANGNGTLYVLRIGAP